MLSNQVGLVSAGRAAAAEVAGHLARDGVGLGRAVDAAGRAEAGLLAGLHALQADPAIGVIVLVSGPLSRAALSAVLGGVAACDKPAIVCCLGADRRLVSRAGAIPAARLDEAGMRAAAWVLGWDQALVSANLEALDDQLAALACQLRPRSPGRLVRGIFVHGILAAEARLMLSEVAGQSGKGCVCAGPRDWLAAVREAAADPDLVALVIAPEADGGAAGRLAALAELSALAPPAPVIARCLPAAPEGSRDIRLLGPGIVEVPGNAAAARLAGMIARPRGC